MSVAVSVIVGDGVMVGVGVLVAVGVTVDVLVGGGVWDGVAVGATVTDAAQAVRISRVVAQTAGINRRFMRCSLCVPGLKTLKVLEPNFYLVGNLNPYIPVDSSVNSVIKTVGEC